MKDEWVLLHLFSSRGQSSLDTGLVVHTWEPISWGKGTCLESTSAEIVLFADDLR